MTVAITPGTVARHELIGLPVEVVDDPDERDGIEGHVVDETTNTLVIGNGRERTVPKQGATFAFVLPSGERVLVEGNRLVARPARRTETTGDSIWQSD